MIEWTHLTEVLADYAEKVRKGYISKIEKHKATGELAESVEIEVVENDKHFVAIFHAKEYWKFLEEGRPATTQSMGGILQPLILKWVTVKGIVPDGKQTLEQLSWAITKKIHKEGYRGTHSLQQALDEVDENDLIEKIKEAIKQDIYDYLRGL